MTSTWLHPRAIIDQPDLGEAELLAEIHGAAFARTWSEDDFAHLLSEPAVFAVTVRRQSLFGGRHLAGFVIVRVAADEAEILTIAVRRGDRGRGYGRLLMEEVLRRLYRERIAACFLEVDRDNRVAIALYRSLGFVIAGERPGYYPDAASDGRAALVMRVHLR